MTDGRELTIIMGFIIPIPPIPIIPGIPMPIPPIPMPPMPLCMICVMSRGGLFDRRRQDREHDGGQTRRKEAEYAMI